MGNTVKIGNMSFNKEGLKNVSFDQFRNICRGKLYAPGYTLEQLYEQVTGNKPQKEVELPSELDEKPRKKRQRKDDSGDHFPDELK